MCITSNTIHMYGYKHPNVLLIVITRNQYKLRTYIVQLRKNIFIEDGPTNKRNNWTICTYINSMTVI